MIQTCLNFTFKDKREEGLVRSATILIPLAELTGQLLVYIHLR